MAKIVIMGGGSSSWGPTFLRDIFVTPALSGSTVCLHDIDAERMDLNHRLGLKMIADFSLDFRLEQRLDLAEALTGADFILLAISTGGLEAMRADLEIPWRYGIRQSVGDTVGPGGILRALRSLPVVEQIGRQVEALCPQAWMLNYTNPLAVLTRALDMQRSVRGRTVGLCHEWNGVRNRLAALLGVKPGEVTGGVGGINHFIWLTDLQAGGRSAWADLPSLAEKILAGELEADPGDDSVFADRAMLKARLFQLYGALPAAGDRHIAEFLPWVLSEATNWGADLGIRLTRIEDRARIMADERTRIESALRGEIPLEPFLKEAPEEAAGPILEALVSGGGYQGMMNLPNSGQIPGLPRQAVVETWGLLDGAGARALVFDRLPPAVHALVEGHVRLQELTLAAGLAGDRALALQVLLGDPLTSRLPADRVERMLAEMIEANRTHLGHFFNP